MFKKLLIRNFRGIERLTISNLNQINIFVGENGIGKTTLLDAIYVAINPNNAGLGFKTNIFRGIDDPFNNPRFWKTLFYNFTEDNRIEISLGNSKRGRSLIIEPEFISKNIISAQKQKPLNELEKAFSVSKLGLEEEKLLGLNIKFVIDGREYISKIIQHEENKINIQEDERYKEELFGNYLNNTSFLDNNAIASKFSNIVEAKKKSEVVNLLKQFKKTIQDIELNVKQRILANDRDFNEMVFINVYGDGLLRALHIICNVLANDSNIVLIDELENGLHRKYQKHIFQAILPLLAKPKKQLFATTHSNEIVKNLYEIAQQEGKATEVSVHRLQRNKNEELEAISFSGEKLKYFLDTGSEFR